MAGEKIGGSIGNYGDLLIPSLSNIPGARAFANYWMDSFANLWLFGGLGIDSNGQLGNLNDLWKFDGYNWTWIAGNNTIINGEYSFTTNYIGPRFASIGWFNTSTNTLWLFGSTTSNDMWKFDINCPNGTYSNSGVLPCSPCNTVVYSNVTGTFICLPCEDCTNKKQDITQAIAIGVGVSVAVIVSSSFFYFVVYKKVFFCRSRNQKTVGLKSVEMKVNNTKQIAVETSITQ